MLMLAPLAEKLAAPLPAGAGSSLAFLLLAGLTLFGAICVVFKKNPVHAALALILTLGSVSGLYVLLEAPFVWAVQLLVYTGGVTVLYLFVIFFSDLRVMERQRWTHAGWWIAIPGLLALAWLLVRALTPAAATLLATAAPAGTPAGGPEQIGKLLFGELAIAFELSSVLLIVALIGAIMLAREERAGEASS